MKRQLFIMMVSIVAVLTCLAVSVNGEDPILIIAAGDHAKLEVPTFTDYDCRGKPYCDKVVDPCSFSYEWTEGSWTRCPGPAAEPAGWFVKNPNGDPFDHDNIETNPPTTRVVYWQSPLVKVGEGEEEEIVAPRGGEVPFSVHMEQPTNDPYIRDIYNVTCKIWAIWLSIGEHGNDDSMLVPFNNDDDDNDYVLDYEDFERDNPMFPFTENEDDLVQIELELFPCADKGTVKLTQETGSGLIRVWADEDREEEINLPVTWNLVSAPFGAPTIYVEGIARSDSVGDVTLRLEYFGPEGITQCGQIYDEIKLTVVDADLDVDTLNDDGFEEPEDNPEEEILEDKLFNEDEEPILGKCLRVNNTDTDHDCIRDYWDGYNGDETPDTDDDENLNNQFVPIVLTLSNALNIDGPEDYKKARIKISYDYARPPVGTDPDEEGTLRIWCEDADEEREVAVDFVEEEPDRSDNNNVYFAHELGFTNSLRTVTFYIEGIESGENVDIIVEVDPDYPEDDEEHAFVPFLSDKVYVTVINNDDYVYEAVTGVTPSVGREIPVAGMDVYAETFLHNRQMKVTHVNCAVPGVGLDTVISQTYRSGLPGSESLGKCGWYGSWDEHFELVHDYEDFNGDDAKEWGYFYIYQGPDGRRDRFNLTNPANPVASDILIPPGYACKVVREDVEGNSYLYMFMTDGTYRIYLNGSGPCTYSLINVFDRYGNAIGFDYTETGEIEAILDLDQTRCYEFTFEDGVGEGTRRLNTIEFTADETYTYTYSYYEGTDILEKIVVSTIGVKAPLTSSVGYDYATEGLIYDSPLLKWAWIEDENDYFLEVYYVPDGYSPYAFIETMNWGTNGDYVLDEIYLDYEIEPITQDILDVWAYHVDTNAVRSDYKFNYFNPSVDGMRVFDPTCLEVVVDPEVDDTLTTLYDYDGEMRLIQVIYPLKNEVGYEYNVPASPDYRDTRGFELPIYIRYKSGNRENPTGGVTGNSTADLVYSYSYDRFTVMGEFCWYLPVSVKNPVNVVTTNYVPDSAGMITQVEKLNQTNGWDITRYAYNLDGRLQKALSPDGSITWYEYSQTVPFAVEYVVKTNQGKYTTNFNDVTSMAALMALAVIGTEPDYIVQYNTMIDAFGRVEQTINPMGGISNSEYDAFGRVTKVLAPSLGGAMNDREQVIYNYHSRRNLLASVVHSNPVATSQGVYDYISSTTSYGYDGLGRLRTVSEPVDDGNVQVETTYYYDTEGDYPDSLMYVKHPNGAYDHYFYDSAGRQDVTIYNQEDDNTETLDDCAYAIGTALNANSEITDVYVQYSNPDPSIHTPFNNYPDAGIHETTYGRDWLGRAAITTEVVSGRAHNNLWDECGRLGHTWSKDGTSTHNLIFDSWYYYHVNGDVDYIHDNLKNQNVAFEVDLQNRTSTVTTPLGEFTDAFDGLGRNISSDTLGVPTERWFNANGNLLRAGHPDYMGTAPSRVYGTRGDLQSVTVPELGTGGGAVTSIWSSGRGAPGVVQDPLDITTVNTLNLRGSTNLVTEASGLTDERPTDSWQYIQARKSVVNRDTQKTETAYDLAGRATNTKYYYDTTLGAEEVVAYDALGRVEFVYPKKDSAAPSGKWLQYVYYGTGLGVELNDRRQLYQIKLWPDDDVLRQFEAYNQFGLPTVIKEYNYLPLGSPYEVTTARSYYTTGPEAGQIASETTAISGALFDSYTVSYTYDSLGRRATMTYPDNGPELTYGYTDDGLLGSITKGSNQNLLTNNYDQNFRHITGKIIDGGNITYEYASNYLGLNAIQRYANVWGEWDMAVFDYNARGQKEQAGQWQDTPSRTYSYDNLARATHSVVDAGTDKFGSEQILQDMHDNRQSTAIVDGEIMNYVSGGAFNRYASFQDPMGVGGLKGAARLAPYLRVPFTRINFQPDPTYGGPAVPAGFSGDFGEAYDAGRGYGWLVGTTPTPNDEIYEVAATGVEVQKRTYALMQFTSMPTIDYIWEIAVPADDYFVRVVMGEPDDAEDPCYYLEIEGTVVIDEENPDEAFPWAIGNATVTVTSQDGKLTLSGLKNGVGRENNRLCYVEFVSTSDPIFQITPIDGVLPLTYDADGHGNVMLDGQFTYTWDISNRMIMATDAGYDAADGRPQWVRYLYDAMGRRVAQVYSDSWTSLCTIYDGLMPIAEFDGSGNVLARYYHEGVGRPIRVEKSLLEAWTVLTDDRGSVVGVVNPSQGSILGEIVEKLHYNMTGLCKAYNGSDAEKFRVDGPNFNLGRSEKVPFGYLGMYQDRFTGLYHTHFREYDAVHGRWLSEDPAGYADGLNLYQAYMGVNGTDPLGLMEDPEWITESLANSSRYWHCLNQLADLEEQLEPLRIQEKKYRSSGFERLMVGNGMADTFYTNRIFPLESQQKKVYKEIEGLIAELEYEHLIKSGMGYGRAVLSHDFNDLGVRGLYEAIYNEDVYGREFSHVTERITHGTVSAVELATFAVPAAKGLVAVGGKAGGKLAASKFVQQARNLVKPKPAAAAVSNVSAETVAPVTSGVNYGELDALGRPTGVSARITKDMIGTGTPASASIRPPGFQGGIAGQARGHLFGAQLGGSGTEIRNLVTLQQIPANSPVMRGFETQIRRAVEAGQIVDVTFTPVYIGDEIIPRYITIMGQGSDGFNMGVSIINPAGFP